MQRTLTFSRDERLLLIAAAAIPTSKVHSRRLKALLYHLETSAGRDGCFPGQETLAAKMGVTDRTIRNLIKLATDLGLLATDRRGRRQLSYFPNWSALRQFCTAADLAEIAAAVAVDDSGRKARALARAMRSRGEADEPELFSGQNENFPVTTGNHFRSQPETISALPIKEPLRPPEAGGDWEILEKEIFAAGVDHAPKAIAAARSAGVSADEARAVLAYFRGLAGVGPAALFCKLARMRPGEPIDRRWPNVEKSIDPAAAKRQTLLDWQKLNDEAAANRERQAADHASKTEIQTQIAALNEFDRAALRDRLFERLPMMRGRWNRNQNDGLVAECLVEQFKRENEKEIATR